VRCPISGGRSAHPKTWRFAHDQLLTSHPAPRGQIRPGRRIVGQQFDHVAFFELGKSPGEFDDRPRARHAEAVQGQSWL
jgi:hypothetical protein